MQQTNGPHALRVAGRYAKDTIRQQLGRLYAWLHPPTAEDWLNEHHPWAVPLVERLWAEALAEHRAKQAKGGARE